MDAYKEQLPTSEAEEMLWRGEGKTIRDRELGVFCETVSPSDSRNYSHEVSPADWPDMN